MHVHLGLLGKLTFADPDPDTDLRPVVGQIRWRLENDSHYADLRGPQACQLIDAAGITAITERLGPDPLREDADPDAGWAVVHPSTTPIGLLLMDQRVAAGVGNIFRAEVLYRHRIDPTMAGRLLRRAEWDAIWTDLVGLMHDAVVRGRIDTVRPEHDPAATGRAPRVDRHGGEVYVYRRAGSAVPGLRDVRPDQGVRRAEPVLVSPVSAHKSAHVHRETRQASCTACGIVHRSQDAPRVGGRSYTRRHDSPLRPGRHHRQRHAQLAGLLPDTRAGPRPSWTLSRTPRSPCRTDSGSPGTRSR